jgi:hypothetical protein
MSYVFIRRLHLLALSVIAVSALFVCAGGTALAVTNPQNGSFGLEGTVNGAPPTSTAPISVPSNGQTFTTEPVVVSGICSGSLLVELFSNGVFIGSAQCKSGSYSITASLFEGQNVLLTRVYDALNQSGPDSPTVTVTFHNSLLSAAQQVLLTTPYALRGATPGTVLSWPISIAGGTSPYAISVDWGDGSSQDLLSESFATTFTIQHTYKEAGVYTILVKATDHAGALTFLQLVGIGNGEVVQNQTISNASGGQTTTLTKTTILWEPAALAVPLLLLAFWLGRRYEVAVLRRNYDNYREQDH